MKRIVAVGDFHCGHRVGLTPPAWQDSPETGPEANKKFARFQRDVWNFYASTLADLQPIDYLFFLGDAIEGKNERAGATELITADRIAQADMAVKCIEEAEAGKVYMVYGTPYHTGADEDWEEVVAKKLGAEISGHEWIEVEGLTFDLKHFVGGSQIPHGRYTAIARDMLWNMVWSTDNRQPLSDVVLRAHVHYHRYIGEAGKLGIILPALQGYGSKFGVRKCSGTVDIGLVSMTVNEGKLDWQSHILKSDLLRIEPKKP